MDFYDIVRQVLELLQRDGRTTYRALQRQFGLDDAALEDLKEELFFTHPVVDEAGRGLVLMATKGFGAAEVERVYKRAPQLCQQIGDTAHLFPVLRGLWQFSILRAESRPAYELAEGLTALDEALALVDERGDRWCEAELHRLQGELLMMRVGVAEHRCGTKWPGAHYKLCGRRSLMREPLYRY